MSLDYKNALHGLGEKTYRCASHEMRVFGAIGSGASSVVQRAIHIPTYRIIALKKINIFEKVCISNCLPFTNLLCSLSSDLICLILEIDKQINWQILLSIIVTLWNFFVCFLF